MPWRNGREGKAPAVQFYAADYLADEKVVAMTLAQVGAYSLLLMLHWREGSIPAEPERIARLVRCQGQSVAFRALWKWPLADCFVPHPDEPGRLVQPRMFDDLKVARSRHLEAVASGVLGGRKSAKLRAENQGCLEAPSTSAICNLQSASATREEKNPPPPKIPLAAVAAAGVTMNGNGAPKPKGRRPTKAEQLAALGPDADFDCFWTAYPRKIAKAKARLAWSEQSRLRRLPPIDAILVALKALRGSEQWRREAGRYIPYPATWLNQGGWDDVASTEVTADDWRTRFLADEKEDP